jgi:ubiquinone/menaquinone biosynthesis C-methylase UbiE
MALREGDRDWYDSLMNDTDKRLASAVFWEIHQDVPRQGPGNNESTARALAMCSTLPARPHVLDVGCGPGTQTIELAIRTGGDVVAVDLHQLYLDELRARAEQAQVSDRIQTLQGSMFDLTLQPRGFDLIWAEGAIYIIGFEKGLREWSKFLKPNGYVAVSHISWLSTDISDEPRRFWAENYPAITSIDENCRIATESGYEVIDCFSLPENAWWDDYYTPMETRLRQLRIKHCGDAAALQAIDGTQAEIDLYRSYSRSYGYVFYVCRKVD